MQQPAPIERRPSRLAQLGPFFILALGAAWLLRHFHELPERIPIHWNARFVADGFAPRTPLTAAMPLLIGAVICLALLATQAGLRRSVPATPLRASTIKTLLGGEYFSALLCCGLLAASATNGRLFKPVLALAALGILALIVFSWAAARGVPRDPVRNPSGWRGGFFYVDREDPALFVPKRYGYGYTFNFGHPAALPLTVGCLVLPFLILALVALLH